MRRYSLMYSQEYAEPCVGYTNHLGGEVILKSSEWEGEAESEARILNQETRRLYEMLYRMTSLTDWMREGYSEAEYNAIVSEFGKEE